MGKEYATKKGSVLGMTPNYIWRWGSVAYALIAITAMFTLTQSSSC